MSKTKNSSQPDASRTKDKLSLTVSEAYAYTLDEIQALCPTKEEGCKVLTINARSLKAINQNGNKFDQINKIVECLEPNVISVTETWLSKADTPYYNIPNYEAYHLTRPNEERGGGLVCYVRGLIKERCISIFNKLPLSLKNI